MPFALITIGILMVVVGFKGTYKQFGAQLASDFTGPGNFIYWIVSLLAIGAIGYIPEMEKFSRMFMALIIIALFFSNKGFFAQFNSAITSGTAKAPPAATPNVGPLASSGSSSGVGNILSTASSLIGGL